MLLGSFPQIAPFCIRRQTRSVNVKKKKKSHFAEHKVSEISRKDASKRELYTDDTAVCLRIMSGLLARHTTTKQSTTNTQLRPEVSLSAARHIGDVWDSCD